jgi:type IV secretion system protein VirD4
MIWQGSPLGFTKKNVPIDYDGNAPTLIFGPQGSSKTVGYVCNVLLDDDTGKRSYLVLDPKGEVCAITSKFRRSLRGHTVKIINPYGVLVDQRPDMISDGWNPIGDLKPDTPGYGDACNAKASALIPKNSNESQPIFPNSARSAFAGGINYEVRDALKQEPPQTPSLASVREMLTMESARLAEFIRDMIALNDPDISPRMRKFLDDNKEIQSIKSNIETETAWITQEMRNDMVPKEGGVDFNKFATEPTTIFLIIPTLELQAKAAYLRLALSSALRALYRDDGVPATVIMACAAERNRKVA